VHQPVKMNRNAPAKRKARVYRPVRRLSDHCADAGAPVCPVASDSLFAGPAARGELATTAKQHIFRSNARKTVVETLETKRDCLKDRLPADGPTATYCAAESPSYRRTIARDPSSP
jgi:hypothetical protein